MKESANYSVQNGSDQRSSLMRGRDDLDTHKFDHNNAISISISQKEQADELLKNIPTS